MAKRYRLFIPLVLVAAFFIVNRGAGRGYFQADELDNLSWAPSVRITHYLQSLASPLFDTENFRPVGHFFFYAGDHLFGLHFRPYLISLQLIHLFNVWLLWLLIRRLGASTFAACAACVLFAFHMALFDAFWKPMYVFDVVCATFCLLSLLAYAHGRWILSLLSFWLAYKSKEMAVMLPLVLACYEIWFGQRRWKRLLPFFAVSLSFGLQGLLRNPNTNNAYTFHFTPAALASSSVFYSGRVFLVPYLGFVLPLFALVSRNRRTWFGLAAMVLLFVPLLFLPGRLSSAYCYVPFLGLAVAFSGVAEATHPAAILAFLLLFAPLDWRELRAQRRATLDLDDQVRAWVSGLAQFTRSAPRPHAVVYSGSIPGFESWGMVGAVHYLYQDLKLPVWSDEEARNNGLATRERALLLVWKSDARRLDIVKSNVLSVHASYLRMDGTEPPTDLLDGWYDRERDFRWVAPHSVVRVFRPENANVFTLRANVNAEMLRALGPVTVRVSLGEIQLPPRVWDFAGWQTVQWSLPPGPAADVLIDIRTSPAYHAPGDSRTLGIAIATLGFEP